MVPAEVLPGERLLDHPRGELPEPGGRGGEPLGGGPPGLGADRLVIYLVRPGADQLLQLGHRLQRRVRLPAGGGGLDQELRPHCLEQAFDFAFPWGRRGREWVIWMPSTASACSSCRDTYGLPLST